MTPPEPNMLPISGHEIMEARHRKIIKLEFNKEKSLAEQKQNPNNPKEGQSKTENDIQLLPHLDDSSFSELDHSKDDDEHSYDSSVHDVFEDQEEQMIIRDQSQDNINMEIDKSILSVRKIQQSYLIIDFKNIKPLNPKNQTNDKPPGDNNSHKSPILYKSPPPPQLMNSSKMPNKKPSFMQEYYSSNSKMVSSTNILQKYIRSKRGQ